MFGVSVRARVVKLHGISKYRFYTKVSCITHIHDMYHIIYTCIYVWYTAYHAVTGSTVHMCTLFYNILYVHFTIFSTIYFCMYKLILFIFFIPGYIPSTYMVHVYTCMYVLMVLKVYHVSCSMCDFRKYFRKFIKLEQH